MLLNMNRHHATFGSPMPNRSFSASSYKYGFNGKENDNETVATGQGTQDYGLRIYNPALGRFLSVDPLTASFPWNSTYAFSENRPIDGLDLDGGEYYTYLYKQTKTGTTLVAKFDYTQTKEGQGSRGPGVLVKIVGMDGKIREQFVKSAPRLSAWEKFEKAYTKKAWEIEKKLSEWTEVDGNGNTSDVPSKDSEAKDGGGQPSQPDFSPYDDPLDPTKEKKNYDKKTTGSPIVEEELSPPEQVKKNDSIVIENFLYKDKPVDVKAPTTPEADGDTHALILEGKDKGKRIMIIDNPPIEKKK